MSLRPIFASLRHHKLTAGLLVLQTALTCAILINALPMIASRIERISTPSGVDEDRLSLVTASSVDKNANAQAQQITDLDALRRVPGVESAVVIGWGLPFSNSANAYGVCPSEDAWKKARAAQNFDQTDCLHPDVYNGSPGFVQAMGLHIVEGSDFHTGDYVSGDVSSTILTQSLARKLYPGQSALGKILFKGQQQIRVVGIVDDVLRPIIRSPAQDHLVMLWPQLPVSTRYLLRSAPADRDRVIKAALAALAKVNSHRLFPPLQQRTLSAMRHRYFRRDVTMIGLLAASSLGLLFVTALGIAGLASFWVQQRTRTIGIRRAIGATRGDILRYFQAENFIIVGGGIVFGLLLAVALNMVLMSRYEVARLPLFYLPAGALAMLLLGQLAVWNPALRAASVPPVVATRLV